MTRIITGGRALPTPSTSWWITTPRTDLQHQAAIITKARRNDWLAAKHAPKKGRTV